MKIISTVVSISLVVLVIYAVHIQNNAFKIKHAFMAKCAERGGVFADAETGWVHETLTCSK